MRESLAHELIFILKLVLSLLDLERGKSQQFHAEGEGRGRQRMGAGKARGLEEVYVQKTLRKTTINPPLKLSCLLPGPCQLDC